MVLNQLKQIRNELKSSADAYDTAFKNTALMAATELVEQQKQFNSEQSKNKQLQNKKDDLSSLKPVMNKPYFINKYGSLKNAKTAYQKIYCQQKFGRSWSDFLAVVNELPLTSTSTVSSTPKTLTLESIDERITNIENFLRSLGYQP